MNIKNLLLAVLLAGVVVMPAFPASSTSIDLSGSWKFHTDPTDIGLQKNWQMPGYDSSSWQSINAPGHWENQGITQVNPQWRQSDDLNQPYTGYAWYRRSVMIPTDWQGKNLVLRLGRVDDLDWTYVNGKLVGQTTSRGGREWVSSVYRIYDIPEDIVKYGQPNVIAVRVLDLRGVGGLVEGPVSIGVEDTDRAVGSGTGARGRDAVQVVGNIVVESGETVGDAVAVCGNITVRGHVTGDAVVVLGNLKLEPGARVDGDVVCVMGSVKQSDNTVIGGEVVNVAPTHLPFDQAFFNGSSWLFWLLFIVISTIVRAILAAVLVAFFPVHSERVAKMIVTQPGISAIWGLVFLVSVLPAFLILLVSCIGIPLIPLAILLVLAVEIFGRTVIGLVLGRKLGDALNHPFESAVTAAVIGTVVIGLIKLVPFVGALVVFVLGMTGMGAVVATKFGKRDYPPTSEVAQTE